MAKLMVMIDFPETSYEYLLEAMQRKLHAGLGVNFNLDKSRGGIPQVSVAVENLTHNHMDHVVFELIGVRP